MCHPFAQHEIHAHAVFIDAADGTLLGKVYGHDAHSLGEYKANNFHASADVTKEFSEQYARTRGADEEAILFVLNSPI
jgi:hypothetical protein